MQEAIFINRMRAALIATALAITGMFVFGAVHAAPAAAGTLPAICSEYPDLPQCDQGGGGGGSFCDNHPNADRCNGGGNEHQGDNRTHGTNPAGTGGGTGHVGGGKLPFTGYPLSALLLLLVSLLAGGMLIRGYLAVRQRLIDGSDHRRIQ